MRFPPACLPLVLAAGLLSVTSSLRAEEAPAPQLGKIVADFALQDAAGKTWSLADHKGQKAVVVLFLGTECPINNAYLPRLNELAKEYAARGVAFVGVNANRQDTATRIADHAQKHALTFPVLRDADHAVADRFGARRTPEAFVLDGERRIRYQGRIDDQFGIGYSRPQPTRSDLVEALNEVVAGKAVTRAATPVAGCLISRGVQAKAEGGVTYTRQVARILQKNCQACHRPGQIGPMALLSYDDAAAWSETIREVLQDGRMPPWRADPRYGKFVNDRSISKEDRATLLAWIEQGCPKGDDRDLPPPQKFPENWRIGKPDAVFSMDRESTVPAKAPTRGLPYRYFMVATDFPEDRWIQAAEARPGNRSVVHHIIVYVTERGKRPGNHEDKIGNGFLVGYAPGDEPAAYPAGMAKKLPKGGLLVFQMHYTPNGVEQKDRSSVGLIFTKEPPKLEVRTRAIMNPGFRIPAGDASHKVVSRTAFRDDAVLLSFLPHMHLRGKSFEYKLITPDGQEEILMAVPHYDFGWQATYRLQQPRQLPKGSRIECTAYYDNSTANPNNPDPTKEVRWGDQTWQEMMIGFVDYAYTGAAAKKSDTE
jgi:peroxiredoxin